MTGGRDGLLRIYLNVGTDADPVFNGYSNIKLNSANFDAGYSSTPYVVDWNNDNKKDIICGEDYGQVWLLINVGTDADPVFTTADHVKDGAVNLDVGIKSAPVAADWNRDGKKDLLVGDYNGNVYYYENTGTDQDPQFNGSVLLQAGGATLDVEYYARLDVADWDNDGILDLISGNRDYYASPSGGIWFFHALGPLSADNTVLSKATGGTIKFAIDAGVANAGRKYFLLGSASGTSPGITLPGGAVLPLNPDKMFHLIRLNYNNPMLQNFRSVLDGAGKAWPVLNVSSVSLPPGTILHFAYTTENPYDYQSNPVQVEIVP